MKNYPLLNYDMSNFHRFQTGIELMTNNKNNYMNKKSVLKKKNTCASQSMKNIFLNTNYLDKEKKKNIKKITSDNNLINKKKYFNSRNEKLNVPVKLIKFNQENKIPFYNTSSYNSSIINENEQRRSMEISYTNNESLSKLSLRQLKKNYSDKLNNKPLNILKANLNENQNFINFINQPSIQNINFKKKKNRDGKKKRLKTFKKQLSKISESSKNDLNEIYINKKNKTQKEIPNDDKDFIFDDNEKNDFFCNKNKTLFLRNHRKSKTQKINKKLFQYSNQQDSGTENEDKKTHKNNNLNVQKYEFKIKNLIEKLNDFFEEQIEDNVRNIDGINYHQKKNFILNIIEGIKINLECKKTKYLHQIENFILVKNKIKSNSFKFIKNEKKNEINYDPKIYKHINYFIYKFQKSISHQINDLNIQKYEIKKYFKIYFEINLPLIIIEEDYFNNKIYQNEKKSMIENFQDKLKKKTKVFINKKRGQSFLSTIIPYLDNFPKKDFYFILRFYQIDYEYCIIQDTLSIEKIISNIKLKIQTNTFNNYISKIKAHLRRSSQHLNIQDTIKENLKKQDKKLLQKALINYNFFNRPNNTIINNNKQLTIRSLKLSYKNLKQRLIERKHTRSDGVNKLQMISKANELKYQMLKSLNSHRDEIIFYIKDRNYPGFISTFEKYKVDPDIKDSEGNSLLSIAVQSNSFQIVNYLLNSGATPNTKNDNNNTPLHFALTFHNFEIADMLIQRGADEKAPNRMGITPWQCLDNGFSII